MTAPNVSPAVRRPLMELMSNQETLSPPASRTVLIVDDYPAVLAWAGPGSLITDDRPRPEYFLLRRVGGYLGP